MSVYSKGLSQEVFVTEKSQKSEKKFIKGYQLAHEDQDVTL